MEKFNADYWQTILIMGCPRYLYHVTDTGEIEVFSRLGMGKIQTLRDEDQARLFWMRHRSEQL